MSAKTGTAASWTCNRCEVSVRRIDGERAKLPVNWASSDEGLYCLGCRRERAAEAALEGAPSDSTHDARARLRRAGLIEFEVRRTPERNDNSIARACRSSASTVTQVRRQLVAGGAKSLKGSAPS